MTIRMRSLLIALVCAAGLTASAEDAATVKPPAFRYDAKGRRDPFVPLVVNGRLMSALGEASSKSTSLVLQGILWDPSGRSIALIGDLESKVGDMVNGYEITEIRQDAVVLSGGGERMVLQLQFDAPRPALTNEPGGSDE